MNPPKPQENKPRPFAPYYIVTGLGALLTPLLISNLLGRTDYHPDWQALAIWILVGATGVVSGFQISRLGRHAITRVFGALLLVGHCFSLLLLIMLCGGRG